MFDGFYPIFQRIVDDEAIKTRSCSQSRSSSRAESPNDSQTLPNHSQFNYVYEFSETRKVLEEFFKPSDKSQFQVK